MDTEWDIYIYSKIPLPYASYYVPSISQVHPHFVNIFVDFIPYLYIIILNCPEMVAIIPWAIPSPIEILVLLGFISELEPMIMFGGMLNIILENGILPRYHKITV